MRFQRSKIWPRQTQTRHLCKLYPVWLMEEIRQTHQLRLVVCPIIYKVWDTSRLVQDFFHQQHVHGFRLKGKSVHQKFCIEKFMILFNLQFTDWWMDFRVVVTVNSWFLSVKASSILKTWLSHCNGPWEFQTTLFFSQKTGRSRANKQKDTKSTTLFQQLCFVVPSDFTEATFQQFGICELETFHMKPMQEEVVVEAQIPAPAPAPPVTEPVLVRAPSFCEEEGLSPWCFGVKTVWDVGS